MCKKKIQKQKIDKMTLRWCFLQLSRDLTSDFVPLLSEWVTFDLLFPDCITPTGNVPHRKLTSQVEHCEYHAVSLLNLLINYRANNKSVPQEHINNYVKNEEKKTKKRRR